MSDSLTTTCSALKDSLLSYFGAQMEVSADRENTCVLTFPMKTVDGRYVEIYVEPTLSDYVRVHDGGNAVAELFLNGIHMTDVKSNLMLGIARRYGASFEDNAFSIATKRNNLSQAILAVAQCTSIAMWDFVKHQPVLDDEVVAATVRRALTRYRPTEVEMRYSYIAKGEAEHRFDAVAFPRVKGRRTVAVKTLGTAYSPRVQSERYGYLGLDLQNTQAGKWPRLAVIAKVERWPREALGLVRKHSNKVLELKTGEDSLVEQELSTLIDELAA